MLYTAAVTEDNFLLQARGCRPSMGPGSSRSGGRSGECPDALEPTLFVYLNFHGLTGAWVQILPLNYTNYVEELEKYVADVEKEIRQVKGGSKVRAPASRSPLASTLCATSHGCHMSRST
jgi:hypothetical protein